MAKKDVQNAKPTDAGKVRHLAEARKKRRRGGSGAGGGAGGGSATPAQSTLYAMRDGRIVRSKPTQDGPQEIPLCEFTAWIERQLIYDDGESLDVHFEICGRGRNGRVWPTVIIPAESYSGMAWVTKHWGAHALIHAGQSVKDHLRAAIQTLSHDVEEKVIYQHTGWRKFGDEWVYLHCDGALGSNGTDTSIQVELGQGVIDFYRLPNPPRENQPVVDAIHSALDLMNICPDKPAIGVVLLSSVLRAVLAEALAPNNAPHLVGGTGSRKSCLAALAQGFFGAQFDYDQLPVGWADTAPAIEAKLYMVKDAIAVIDDFKPSGTRNETAKVHGKAENVLRAMANQQGRGKMSKEHELQISKVSRAWVLSTGEDTPNNESLRARMTVLEMDRGDIDLARLTELQEAGRRGDHALMTAAFIQDLAPLMDRIKDDLPQRAEAQRKMLPDAWHGRTADAAAAMAAVWDWFGAWMLYRGALTAEQWAEFDPAIRAALYEAADAQQATQQQDNEAARFADYLRAMFLTSRVHLNRMDGGRPPHGYLEHVGWKDVEDHLGSRSHEAQGECIGWLDAEQEHIWLETTATFQAIQRYANQGGGNLSVNKETLGKRIKAAGLLAASDGGGRSTKRLSQSISGKPSRSMCWVLPLKIISSFSKNNRSNCANEDKGLMPQGVALAQLSFINRATSRQPRQIEGELAQLAQLAQDLAPLFGNIKSNKYSALCPPGAVGAVGAANTHHPNGFSGTNDIDAGLDGS